MSETTRKGRHKAYRDRGKWEAIRSEDTPIKPAERRQGDELTHYQPKKVQWAISAKKMARRGWGKRKIAKRVGASVDEVERVLGDAE